MSPYWPVVRDRVARARALLDAARNNIYATVGDAFAYVSGGPRLTVPEAVPVALAGTFGVDAAVQVVEAVHMLAGTSGIRDEAPFQQSFRDVHTVSQHAFASSARFESLGKMMLGGQTEWAFYYV